MRRPRTRNKPSSRAAMRRMADIADQREADRLAKKLAPRPGGAAASSPVTRKADSWGEGVPLPSALCRSHAAPNLSKPEKL